MSHLDLRKSEEMCKCITGAGERLAEDINFIHILILTFYCNKYLDKGWITLWVLFFFFKYSLFFLFSFFYFTAWACRILSSLTRDWTHAPYSGRVESNHWTAREVPMSVYTAEGSFTKIFQKSRGQTSLINRNKAVSMIPNIWMNKRTILLKIHCIYMIICIQRHTLTLNKWRVLKYTK